MASRTLMKKAREKIISQIEELGEISIEEAMEIIEPHFIFDSEQAKRSAIRRTATNIIARIKDDKGIRKNFIVKDKNQNSKAIDVEKSKSIKELKTLKEHLKKTRDTTDRAIWKIDKRAQVLSGQLSMEDIEVKEG